MPPYFFAGITLWRKCCVSLLGIKDQKDPDTHNGNHTDSCSCCSFRSGMLLMESEEWAVSWWALVSISFRILPFPSWRCSQSRSLWSSFLQVQCTSSLVDTDLSSATWKIYPETFNHWNKGRGKETEFTQSSWPWSWWGGQEGRNQMHNF